MPKVFENIRKSATYYTLIAWRAKPYWIRALLCWLIACFLVKSDEFSNIDLRLKLRGPRSGPTQIILVDIAESPPTEWPALIEALLAGRPAAVGFNVLINQELEQKIIHSFGSPQRVPILTNPRIVWSADLDLTGRPLIPAFGTSYNSNVGLRGFRLDDDGKIRRYTGYGWQIPHLATRLAEISDPSFLNGESRGYRASRLINYRGSKFAFPVLRVRDLIGAPPSMKADLRGKTILVGSLSDPADIYNTPVGALSRTEIIANAVDNILNHQSVQRIPESMSWIILAAILALSLWVIATYPQSVTLLTFFLIGTLWAAFGVWLFDTAAVWVPVFSVFAQLIVTYVAFLSYQLALNEQRTWRMSQEQKYLSEIEQLKSNFVSMMSHDLKTPIAKIQAICDRILSKAPQHEHAEDIKSLRRTSDDLHRYIQSILQVSKVEAKDFRITKEVTDLNDNIEKVVGRLLPLAAEKNIRIETELEPMFSIEVDITLIQEVIHNLIENAIKYSPLGGIVTVSSAEQDDDVFVWIKDTGPGIKREEHAEVWKKFTRGRDMKSIEPGTGLGLYLVKYFIELQGGRVYLESELGKGTKIGFSIPINAKEFER